MSALFLASVTSVEEGVLAQRAGADIVDCKNPAAGALGALEVATVAAIVTALPGEVIVSATIGDLVPEPARVVAAVEAMATSGCDIIKIGLFDGGDVRATLAALGAREFASVHLVGLLLADQSPEFSLIDDMAAAGFAGVMVDTARKDGSRLRDHLDDAELGRFVAKAHARGLFAGLAGSLRLSDVAALMRLKPNIIGLRGALCAGGQRTDSLDAVALRAVRAEFDRAAGALHRPAAE